MKKMIVKELPFYVRDVFEGVDLDAAIAALQDIPYQYPEYSDFYFDVNYDYESTYLVLKAKRLETDEESKKRITKEKKEKEIKKISLENKKANLIKEAKKLGLKVVEK